jgi:hypothetical protein
MQGVDCTEGVDLQAAFGVVVGFECRRFQTLQALKAASA